MVCAGRAWLPLWSNRGPLCGWEADKPLVIEIYKSGAIIFRTAANFKAYDELSLDGLGYPSNVGAAKFVANIVYGTKYCG